MELLKPAAHMVVEIQKGFDDIDIAIQLDAPIIAQLIEKEIDPAKKELLHLLERSNAYLGRKIEESDSEMWTNLANIPGIGVMECQLARISDDPDAMDIDG